MTYPRVSHLSDNRQIANAINQALKLGESAGTGTGTGTVTTTGTPASGNLAKFSGSTSITNADLTGDVTTSGALATTIASGAVTLAKMANMATSSLIYRKTAGAGAPEVNSLATLKTDLGLTGTNSGDQTITLTGDVTGSGTGSFAATLATSGVTAGTYTNATVTFDAKGRATSASSGVSGLGNVIEERVISVASSGETFSSLGSYRDIIVCVRGRGSASATNINVLIQFNGDTGTNYDHELLTSNGTTVAGAGTASATEIRIGVIAADTAPSGASGAVEATILDAKGTTFNKTVLARGGLQFTSATTGQHVHNAFGQWRSTAAVTSEAVERQL